MDYRNIDRILIQVGKYDTADAAVIFEDGKVETARNDTAVQLVNIFKLINPKCHIENTGNNRYELHRQKPVPKPVLSDRSALQYQNLAKLDYSIEESVLPHAPNYNDFGAEYEVSRYTRNDPDTYPLGFRPTLTNAQRLAQALGGISF